MVVRRGNSGSLIATSLDGLIVGLAAASVSAAFLLSAVLKTTHGSTLSAATQIAYPVADLLLLALAIGGLAILPKGFRWFLVLASVAFAVNAIGDTSNLLSPDSKIGFISNASAWPISLLLLVSAIWVENPMRNGRTTFGGEHLSRPVAVQLPSPSGQFTGVEREVASSSARGWSATRTEAGGECCSASQQKRLPATTTLLRWTSSDSVRGAIDGCRITWRSGSDGLLCSF
jgi:hypothetical protein